MYVGYHVNKHSAGSKKHENTFAFALVAAKEHILESLPSGVRPAAQIFVHGPKTHEPNVTTEDAEEIKNIPDLSLVIHGAFPDYPWRNNPRAVEGIRGELRLADAAGASGVIIHLGHEAASRETLLRVLGKIDRDLDLSSKRTLWLETNVTTAEKATFATPKGLRELMSAVRSRAYTNIRVGLCLDTAHLHSCGMELQTTTQVESFLEALPKAKYLLHLNDSKMSRGSGRDQHEALGRGEIWEHDQSGLHAFVKWAKRTRTAIILERHPDDLDHDLKVLSRIIDTKNE